MERLDILRRKVEELYTSGNPNADRWNNWGYKNHVLVVGDLAEKIAKSHGANVEFAVAGALLHDIADTVMPRKRPEHETESLAIADNVLQESGFSMDEADYILLEIIKPHRCNELMPSVLEGKVVAAADGATHFLTDFYPYFCWQHMGPGDDYDSFKAWVRQKLEKDFTKKMFFDDIREEVRPRYEALKLIYS